MAGGKKAFFSLKCVLEDSFARGAKKIAKKLCDRAGAKTRCVKRKNKDHLFAFVPRKLFVLEM